MSTVKDPSNPVNKPMPNDKKPTGEALARRVQDQGPIVGELVLSDPKEIGAQFLLLRQRANLITPVIEVSSIAKNHVVNLSVVKIDPVVDSVGNGKMCYRDKSFMAENERGLNRVGLDMIAAAAGVSWAPHPHSKRTDDGKHPHKWQYLAYGAYTAMDGSIQTIKGESLVDLSDGSEQIGGWSEKRWAELLEENKKKQQGDRKFNIGGWSDKRVLQARRFGLQLAETKARLRAIRTLGVLQKYTVEDLQKPFVLPRVSFEPDMTNPAIADAVVRQKSLGVSALWAQQPAALALPPADAAEAIHHTTASLDDVPAELGGTAATEVSSTPVTTEMTEMEAEPEAAKPKGFRVLSVGIAGADFWIKLDGAKNLLYTSDKALAVALNKCKISGALVEIDAEVKPYPGADAGWKGKEVDVIVAFTEIAKTEKGKDEGI